ncbi:MAG: TIGR03936 family radical SAM-associated protein [Oscillospiraceae bacterium]|nr:TIGR03936 family radical SAM-associated protein [Oscillospiraceae bacterium]
MAKLRLLFVKEEQASYISHLDLMRTFQRVFPRGGLELKHSQGFHPHPLISIVLPLPVGQSSDCELLDFEVEQDMDGTGIADMLNTGLPAGLRVRDCYRVERPARDLAFLRARLELDYDRGVPAGALDRLRELFVRDEVLVEKRTKHKELAQINVVPLIRGVEWREAENLVTADVVVAAQNPGLNPALLANAVSAQLPELAADFARVRRLELYDGNMQMFR